MNCSSAASLRSSAFSSKLARSLKTSTRRVANAVRRPPSRAAEAPTSATITAVVTTDTFPRLRLLRKLPLRAAELHVLRAAARDHESLSRPVAGGCQYPQPPQLRPSYRRSLGSIFTDDQERDSIGAGQSRGVQVSPVCVGPPSRTLGQTGKGLSDWQGSMGRCRLVGVVFVADDLGAWLVGLLADAGRRRLVT